MKIEILPKGIKLSTEDKEFYYSLYPYHCDNLPYYIGDLDVYALTLRSEYYQSLDKESRKIYPKIKSLLPIIFDLLWKYRNNPIMLSFYEIGFEYIYNLPLLSDKDKIIFLDNLLSVSLDTNFNKKIYNNLLKEAIDEGYQRYMQCHSLYYYNIITSYTKKSQEKLYGEEYKPYKDIISMDEFISYRKTNQFKRAITILKNEKAKIELAKEELEKLRTIAAKDGYDQNIIEIDFADELRLPRFRDIIDKLADISTLLKELNTTLDWKTLKTYQQVIVYLLQLRADKANLNNSESNKRFSVTQKKILKDHENDKYKIVIPLNIGDCIIYGNYLHNCLGHYEWNHYLSHGTRVAFVVLNKTTKQYVACVDLNPSSRTIVQCLGPCNSQLRDIELMAFIENYVKTLKGE